MITPRRIPRPRNKAGSTPVVFCISGLEQKGKKTAMNEIFIALNCPGKTRECKNPHFSGHEVMRGILKKSRYVSRRGQEVTGSGLNGLCEPPGSMIGCFAGLFSLADTGII
jgi:hypothetical protein